ncbi:hypothetical protein GCM10010358_41300 [Streptomyces minutiscleroticus]|uniref:Pyrrolo-quinoline quinone repeat domain-containing protein n=1 Tax=Streptomyces minutiscleroticus TaxID=68238 RepID=A0A918U203_9ACTN|nr:PQQ-binding-like beta-propeller repeat protein [Streptomyces minutiscleroticus]GGX82852.1 hypothetical protein GCM10010358_41300 [Streptomyces minutiscleroticus]
MNQPPPPNQPPNQPPSQPPGPPGTPPQAQQQPPQGGFGAPQSPPPGGFGAPQDPGPGYGYPQTPPPAPGQPPAAPSPYGYPQPPTAPMQQPGYGYPQAPPPGYGHPAQPQHPYGPPQPYTVPLQAQNGGPSGGRKVNAQLAIIVAAVVAIALIVGGGVWYANSSGKDDTAHSGTTGGDGGKDGEGGDTASGTGGTEKVPASTDADVLFQVPSPEVPKGEYWSVSGSWLTDEVYAKASTEGIDGYDPDTGEKSWTLALPGLVCAGSPEVTKDGVAAVVYENARPTEADKYPGCSEVAAFDLRTGKKLWTGSVVSDGDQKATFKEVSITGGTVAAGSDLKGGAAFDLKTGKVLWQPKVGKCQDVGYHGGEQLVAVRKCGDYGNETYEVQLLDPRTGSVKWSYELPAGIDNAKVISSKPVVFGVDSGDITASGVTDVFSLDDGGKLRAKITLPDGKYEHDCEVGKVHGCKAIAVGNDKLYVPTKQHAGGGAEYSRTNEIVSFSLATGKSTGDRADAGDGYDMVPVRMDGGDIIAYKDGPYDKGAQIVSLDGGTMKETELLETPATDQVRDAISAMVPRSAELLYTHGRLFMAKDLLSKPYSADAKQYTAIGFGAK